MNKIILSATMSLAYFLLIYYFTRKSCDLMQFPLLFALRLIEASIYLLDWFHSFFARHNVHSLRHYQNGNAYIIFDHVTFSFTIDFLCYHYHNSCCYFFFFKYFDASEKETKEAIVFIETHNWVKISEQPKQKFYAHFFWSIDQKW